MLNLIENLDYNRFTPYVLCPEKGELTDYLEKINVKYFTLPLCSLKPKNIFQIIKNINGIRSIIEENDIHIIHADSERDAFVCGIAKRKINSKVKPKLIWHIRLTLANGLDRFIINFSDFIIGISDACKNRFTKIAYDNKLNKYRTIYNGANLQKFTPININDQKTLRIEKGLENYEDHFIVLFVGQIKEGKGIFDLIDSILIHNKFMNERIDSQNSNSNQNPNSHKYLYLFIGNFDNDVTEKQFNEAINFELNPKISIKHLTQQNDIEKYMQLTDTLILPAHEGNEGMGRVLFEAMACGKPVIGTNVSGVNEAFDGDSGILINPKSPIEITDAIIKLSNDNEIYNQKSIDARKQAIEKFDIKNHALNIEKVYFGLVKKV